MSGPEPIEALRDVTAYRVPRHGAPIDLWLASNEGPAPDAAWRAAQALGELPLERYPRASELEAELAATLGVAPEQVLVTAGADEALDRVCRAYLGPGRDLVLPVPTFEMLHRYPALCGARTHHVDWPEGPYPAAAVSAACTTSVRVLAVVTPNNPTGAVATAADVAQLAAAHPDRLILVDHAYAEFADEDLTQVALAHPNTVVVRTLSKAFGIAGLRVGYAVGPVAVIEALRAAGSPFAVAAPSLALARSRLRARDEVARHIARIRSERETLRNLLLACHAKAPPSQANFVLGRFADAVFVRDALAGFGIDVRAFPGRRELDGALRITCPGDPHAFERLCHALATVLLPQALLFDLDGVLADVRQSYRTAILQTAARFGVPATAAQVQALKARGDANNDWIVTHRLIEAAGARATLADVTAVFEELYQGQLADQEPLLAAPELLARLAAELPLGIVTGRPRRDAERFLRRHGIEGQFRTLVCMEDAPAKPDPAPLQRALAQLGVARAWFVGDTPDDVVAARRAGVLPLGILGTADDERMSSVLIAAGAGRVLGDLAELEGWIR